MNVFNGKRILITGAAGLIGSHLAIKLLELGAEVIVMGRSQARLEGVFASKLQNDRLILCENDISASIPENLGRLDYIFHAASPVSGAEIREYPVSTINANMNGCRYCLDYLKEQAENGIGKGRMIIFSSATVYGGGYTADTVVSEEDTSCADALHTGNTPYSESKRMTEVLARSYNAQYGIDAVIVRIGYVYGYTAYRPNTAFYEFIGKAVSGQDITINNSGMGRRDNIHVDDVVSGLLTVAEKGETSEAYNISSNGDKDNFRAIDEIAHIIADSANEIASASRVNAVIKPFSGERLPGLRLDNFKLKQLGWSVKIGLTDGIADTVRKYYN